MINSNIEALKDVFINTAVQPECSSGIPMCKSDCEYFRISKNTLQPFCKKSHHHLIPNSVGIVCNPGVYEVVNALRVAVQKMED